MWGCEGSHVVVAEAAPTWYCPAPSQLQNSNLSIQNRGKMGFICCIHELLLPRHPAQALSWLNYPKKQKGGVTISCFGIKGINSDFSLSTAQLATGLKHGADGYEIIANSYSLD